MMSVPVAIALYHKRLDDGEQIADPIRFEDKGIGPDSGGLVFVGGIARCQDAYRRGMGGFDAGGQFKAVDFWNVDVRKKDVHRIRRLDILPGAEAIVEGVNFAVDAEFKGVDHKIPHQTVVFNHKNLDVGYDRAPQWG